MEKLLLDLAEDQSLLLHLGALLGLLKKSEANGESSAPNPPQSPLPSLRATSSDGGPAPAFTIDPDWFAHPDLGELPKRREAWMTLLEDLLTEIEGKEDTLIDAASHWYSINDDWGGEPTGFCLVVEKKTTVWEIGLGVFNQFSDTKQRVYSLQAFLPLFSWAPNSPPLYFTTKNPPRLRVCFDIKNAEKKAFDRIRLAASCSFGDPKFEFLPVSLALGEKILSADAMTLDDRQKIAHEFVQQLLGASWSLALLNTAPLKSRPKWTIGWALAKTKLLKTTPGGKTGDKNKDAENDEDKDDEDKTPEQHRYELGDRGLEMLHSACKPSDPNAPKDNRSMGEKLDDEWTQFKHDIGKHIESLLLATDYVTKEGNVFALRLVFPDYSLPLSEKSSFGVDVQLGKWLPKERKGKNWLRAVYGLPEQEEEKDGADKDKSGDKGKEKDKGSSEKEAANQKGETGHGSSAGDAKVSLREGIEIPLVKYDPDNHTQKWGWPDQFGIKIQSVGVDVYGNRAPLFDLQGYTLTGFSLRFAFDSLIGRFGIAVLLDEFGFPLDAPPASGKKSLVSDILASAPDKKQDDASRKQDQDAQQPSPQEKHETTDGVDSEGTDTPGKNGEGKKKEEKKKKPKRKKSPNPAFSLKVAYGWQKEKQFLLVHALDEKYEETDQIWLPLQRDFGPVHCNKLGVMIRAPLGAEPMLGLGFDGTLTVGPLALTLYQLSIHARLKHLMQTEGYDLDLKGLDFSFRQDAVAISGGFLKVRDESYMGQLSVQLPKFALNAVGAYSREENVTSLVIYGALSFSGGGGILVGPMKITGIALGLGLHRRVLIPDQVAEVRHFPLVSMVMGEAGENVPPEGRIQRLIQVLPAKPGHNFGCFGLRFSVAELLDGFALAVAQFGPSTELSLLGLARFDKPICHAELAIRMVLKPDEGSFLAQAELTPNSWILDRQCKLSGGFAMAFWFDGPHKGDFVISLGGYHPRFKPPEHYPVVPRLRMEWPISGELTVKGELYFAITPSMLMAGGRLEAAYHSGPIHAWFVAHVDMLMEWAPLRYEAEAGIAIRIHADILWGIDETALVTLRLWGPDFAGHARVSVKCLSFDIDFGAPYSPPPAIASWAQFGETFLDKRTGLAWVFPEDSGKDWAEGPSLCQPGLVGGLLAQPEKQTGHNESPWFVRADELAFSADTLVPTSEIRLGQLKAFPEWLKDQKTGKPLTLKQPLESETGGGKQVITGKAVAVRPMKAASLASRLDLAIVNENSRTSLDLSEWRIAHELTATPASLWDSDAARPAQPEARMVEGCVTGLTSIRPPDGKRVGATREADLVELRRTRAPVQIAPVHIDKEDAAPPSPSADVHFETTALLNSLGFKLPLPAQDRPGPDAPKRPQGAAE